MVELRILAGMALALLVGFLVAPVSGSPVEGELKKHVLIGDTGSMNPALKGGEVLGCFDVLFEDVERGDVVGYEDGGEFKNVHRVLIRSKNYLLARGDNLKTVKYDIVTRAEYDCVVGVAG